MNTLRLHYNVDSLVASGALILPQRVVTLRPEVELHCRADRLSWVMPQRAERIPGTASMRRSAEYPFSRLLREQVHSPKFCEGCEAARTWGGPCGMCLRERMASLPSDEAVRVWNRHCAELT